MRRRRSSQPLDLMHRLVADDLLQHDRRRRPVDAAQHQEAAVEPGREQMDEVVVHRAEILVAVGEHVHQLLAHANEGSRAAGREIEPPEQFLPARLGGGVHLGRGFVTGLSAPGGDRRFQCARVGARSARPAPRKKRCAGRWSIPHSGRGSRAPAQRPKPRRGRTTVARQLDHAFGAGRIDAAPVARAVDERAAALGNGLQQFAEKRGVHGSLPAAIRTVRSPALSCPRPSDSPATMWRYPEK